MTKDSLPARSFYGLWLFPLAFLTQVTIPARFCAYLVLSLTGLLSPKYEDIISNIAVPPSPAS
jgi:hypothetical protein